VGTTLLTGTFFRALDDKQRLAIPKPIRESLGFPDQKVLYLAPGTDRSLALYSPEVFSRLADQLGEASPNGPEVRAFSRLFYAQAQRGEIDRSGRLRIPAELALLASLQKEIVLLGVRDHLELWNRTCWESYLATKQPKYDEIAERAFGQSSIGEKAQNSISEQPATRPGQPR
jgi:MraZ protein